MKIEIYNTYGSSKIPAIKDLRAVSGLGLKEAKKVIDAVWEGGGSRVVDVLVKESTLRQEVHNFDWRISARDKPSLAQLIEALEEFQPDVTVRQVLSILQSAEKATA